MNYPAEPVAAYSAVGAAIATGYDPTKATTINAGGFPRVRFVVDLTFAAGSNIGTTKFKVQACNDFNTITPTNWYDIASCDETLAIGSDSAVEHSVTALGSAGVKAWSCWAEGTHTFLRLVANTAGSGVTGESIVAKARGLGIGTH